MFTRPPGRIVGPLAAFGGGALLAALSVELVAPTMLHVKDSPHGKELAIALLIGGVLGGVFFWLLDQLLNARGGYLRKTATAITYMAKTKSKRAKQLVSILSSNALFRSIPPDHIELLLDRLKPVNYTPGEKLFAAGSPGDRLYIIESGEVKLTREGSELKRLKAGEILGEIALLTGGSRTAAAEAIGEVIALELTRKDFDHLSRQAPEIGEAVRNLASQRLEELGRIDAESAQASSKWALSAASALRSGEKPPSALEIRREAHRKSGAALGIWLGITLDGIPECFVLGATVLAIITRQVEAGTASLANVIPYTFLIGLISPMFPKPSPAAPVWSIKAGGNGRCFSSGFRWY